MIKIAYQGQKYSNSYYATIEYLKREKLLEKVEIIPALTSSGVVSMLESGECDIGILAKLNSSTGTVIETQKALSGYNYDEISAIEMDVRHCLFINRGSSRRDIKNIISHPQALKQCKKYLKNNFPKASLMKEADTSYSALLLSESCDTKTAVICSSDAGEAYGLDCVGSNINDQSDNKTKFIVIQNISKSKNSLFENLWLALSRTPLIGKLFNEEFIKSRLSGYWLYSIHSKNDKSQNIPSFLYRVVEIKYSPLKKLFISGWIEGNLIPMFEVESVSLGIGEEDFIHFNYNYRVSSLFEKGVRGSVCMESDTDLYSKLYKIKGRYFSQSNIIGEISYTRISKGLFDRIRERR